MGHCNDGELESCQVPFPDVPVLGTKTHCLSLRTRGKAQLVFMELH